MRHILLHPTHRKFIRLLRDRIKAGYLIIFTQSDMEAFQSLWQKEPMTMIDRHQGIYRIVLNAVYRPIDSIGKDEKCSFVGVKCINAMEKCFCEAERKHLRTTLLSGYVLPFMIGILKKGPKGVAFIMAKIVRVFLRDKEEIREVN